MVGAMSFTWWNWSRTSPAPSLQVVDEPADLGVGVLEECGERFLEPGGQALLVLGQAVPRLDAGVARGELGVGRQQAELDLAGEPALAGHVPSLVESGAPLVEVLDRSLMGGVHGPERQVGEERPVGPDGDRVVDEPDGVVDQVLAQVVPVVGGGGGLDVMVVVDEVGGELVGLALEEAVEPVEAPLERPLVEGAGRRGVVHGAEVPLAHRQRGVARIAEYFGHGGGVIRDLPAHVGVAAVEVGDGAHPDRVVVAPGEQGGPGGRAQRGDVEVRIAEAAVGQGVDAGGGEVRAEAPEVGEAGVVEQDHHHVGCVGSGVGRDRPRRGGLGLGAGDDATERLELLHGTSSRRASVRRAPRCTAHQLSTRVTIDTPEDPVHRRPVGGRPAAGGGQSMRVDDPLLCSEATTNTMSDRARTREVAPRTRLKTMVWSPATNSPRTSTRTELTRATIRAETHRHSSTCQVSPKVAGATMRAKGIDVGQSGPFGIRWRQWYPKMVARAATSTRAGAANDGGA